MTFPQSRVPFRHDVEQAVQTFPGQAHHFFRKSDKTVHQGVVAPAVCRMLILMLQSWCRCLSPVGDSWENRHCEVWDNSSVGFFVDSPKLLRLTLNGHGAIGNGGPEGPPRVR